MIWFDRGAREILAGCSVCGARDVGSQAAVDAWVLDHLDRHAVLDDAGPGLARAQAAMSERGRRRE